MKNRLPYLLVLLAVLTACQNPGNSSSSEEGYVPPVSSSEINYFESFNYSKVNTISEFISNNYTGGKTYLSSNQVLEFTNIADDNDHAINKTQTDSLLGTYVFDQENNPTSGHTTTNQSEVVTRNNDSHTVSGTSEIDSKIYIGSSLSELNEITYSSISYDLDQMAYYITIKDSENEIISQTKKSFTPDEYFLAITLVHSDEILALINGYYETMTETKWDESNKLIYLSSSTALHYVVSGHRMIENPANKDETYIEELHVEYVYVDGIPSSFEYNHKITCDDKSLVTTLTEETITRTFSIV